MIYKTLHTNNDLQNTTHKQWSTKHYTQTVIYKTLHTNNDLQNTTHKQWSTKHYTQTMIYKTLHTNNDLQNTTHKADWATLTPQNQAWTWVVCKGKQFSDSLVHLTLSGIQTHNFGDDA